MILVTKKDGTSTALNVDRIERVELNCVSQGRESNVFLVGGGHLVVEEPPDVVIERMVLAKARVLALSSSCAKAEWQCLTEPLDHALRVVAEVGEKR